MSDEKIYRLLNLVILIMGRLPRCVAEYLADSLATIWYFVDKRHRRITLDNLTHAYGHEKTPAQLRRMVRKVFKNLIRMIFEIAWSYSLDMETLLTHFQFKGIENVEAIQKKGRGIIGITGHMGNFEMLILAISRIELDEVHGVYRRLDFAPLERLMLEGRQRFGVKMVPMRGLSKVLEPLLKGGGAMGTLIDQNVDWYKGVFVDFFGRPACTNKGLAALALKTDAVILPLYTVRHNRKFIIEYLPEIPLVRTGDKIKDIETNTQNFTAAIEGMVRRAPEQYFWVHNRWKTKNYCPIPK
ncbi:MAG: lysophospholipid acyltransferase family protein [Desulfobacterales bacterium]|nr:lysophospholipid acyltransferase family protein [Desulfobacterales bacterium]